MICGGRIELRGQQRGKADRPGADDRHRGARLNLAVQHAALEAGRQDVAEHHERFFIGAGGNGYRLVSACGMRTYSACVPSIELPRIQPPVAQCEYMPRRQ